GPGGARGNDDRRARVPPPRARRRLLRARGRASHRPRRHRGPRGPRPPARHGRQLRRRHRHGHARRAGRPPPVTTTLTLVRRSLYQDSVVLLALARELRALPGVAEAAALMATPANRDLLAQSGLLTA